MSELNQSLAAFWVVGLLLPASVGLGTISALLERSSPIRLRHWAEHAGGWLRRLYDSWPRFEAFRFLLNVIDKLAPAALFWAFWQLLSGFGDGGFGGFPLWAALLTLLVVVLGEVLNRRLVERHAEGALKRLTLPIKLLYAVLFPAVWLLRHGYHEPPEEEEQDDEASEDEIQAYIDVGRKEGILEEEEGELLMSIVDFGDSQVRSIMTPRVEMVCGSVDSSLEELAQQFFEAKHSRLPLFSDSIDQIVGVLHIRDLYEAMFSGRQTDAAQLSNPPYFVPESKSLSELLGELQAMHLQLAIVVDEYGGVAGLVTVEDLVEEIVGEILDEHDPAESSPVSLAGEAWRLAGRTELEELNKLFGIDIDPEELPYETVSGLICGRLGYVPKPKEIFESLGLRFVIESADERRVTSVAVRPLAELEVGPTE